MGFTPNFLTGRLDTHKMAVRHEAQTAKAVGGRVTVGSGNKAMKGDVQSSSWMFECKATAKRSLSLKLDWLLKVSREAFERRLTPAVVIRFEEDRRDWILMPLDTFRDLTGIDNNE